MHPEAAHGADQPLECHWVPIPSCHIVCECMHACDSCSAEILDACFWQKGRERRSETISAADKNQAAIPADCPNLPFWPDASPFSCECWYFEWSVVQRLRYSNAITFFSPRCIIVRGIPERGWQEPLSWENHVGTDRDVWMTNSQLFAFYFRLPFLPQRHKLWFYPGPVT